MFSVSKVPGNEELPVEFHKTYWDLLGDLYFEV